MVRKSATIRATEPRRGGREIVESSTGHKLRQVIERIGWNRAAELTGRSVRQLHRYVQGNDPPLQVAARLAVEANVGLDWLANGRIGGDGPTGLADSAGEEWPRHLRHDNERSALSAARSGEGAGDNIGAARATPTVAPAGGMAGLARQDVSLPADEPVERDGIRAGEPDRELLAMVIVALEAELAGHHAAISPRKKAALICDVYALFKEAYDTGALPGSEGGARVWVRGLLKFANKPER